MTARRVVVLIEKPWTVLWSAMLGDTWACGIAWNPGHWMVGIEAYPGLFSIGLCPLVFLVAKTVEEEAG